MIKNNISSKKMVLALRIHTLYFFVTTIFICVGFKYLGPHESIFHNIILSIIALAIFIAVALVVLKGVTGQIFDVIDELKETSTDVLGASKSLADSSHRLAEGSAEQSASVQETSATMEETSSLIQQTTQNTKEAVNLAENAKKEADGGLESVENLLDSMHKLGESSEQVQKIIKVIDDIAFQTNILSLNAAVEAARAGDAGRGFAVVAEEVRNLAQRSAHAAKETAVLIDDNVTLTQAAVKVSEKVGSELNKIDISVSKVKELLDEVSTASQEQVIAATQITQAITQIDQVVQVQSSVASKSADGASALEKHCGVLKDVIVQLIDLVQNPADAGLNQDRPRIGTASEKGKSKNTQKNLKNSSDSPKKLTSGKSERRNTESKTPTEGSFSGAKAITPEDVIPLGDF